LATHAEIARSDGLTAAVPGLSALWRDVANPRIRATGTIGGNLMSGLPHYDGAPALLALGAEATLRTGSGLLKVGIDQLPDHRGALLESIGISENPSAHLLADRSLHPALAIYLAATLREREVRAARIAVGCAYARPVAVDLAVAGMPLAAIAAGAADIAHAATHALPAAMLGDGAASAAYRRRMFTVIVRRLLVRLGALG
jgi:aerobic carbon-monoxide dehydrogenase medium subunit